VLKTSPNGTAHFLISAFHSCGGHVVGSCPLDVKKVHIRHSLGCPPLEKCAENLPPNGTALFLNSAFHSCGGHVVGSCPLDVKKVHI